MIMQQTEKQIILLVIKNETSDYLIYFYKLYILSVYCPFFTD